MSSNRASAARAWITPISVACVLSFLALAQGVLANGLGPCHWTKEVSINDGDVTLITPGVDYSFGVALSDTIHVMDRLWCDGVNYQWTLHESWDDSVVSLWDYQYDFGTVDGDVDYLEWWGDRSANNTVQLDKWLFVGAQGWVTSTISETVDFRNMAGDPVASGELPFYLEELVEGGDAPSSHNHTWSPMTTHITGTVASFPVVWDWDGKLGPGPVTGYWGFCHYPSLALSPSFLGAAKTQELDADLLPDTDPVTNIDPPNDFPNRDGFDDGVTFPTLLPHCGSANVNVVGQNNLAGANLYLNAWADWNRDGDWEDSSLCECGASEWIIQGYAVAPGPFVATIPITPCHPIADPTEPLWARVTLSEVDPLPGTPWIYGGQPYPAPGGCFAEGETEDYLVEPELIPECDWEKQVYIDDKYAGEWDEGPFAVAVSDTVTISESLTCNFGFDWKLLEQWEPPYLSVVSYSLAHGTVISGTGMFEWTGPYAPPGIPITLTKTLHVDEAGFLTLPITETVTFSPDGLLEPEERTIELVELLEGGDAPSSHNHSGPTTMETYAGSGVSAQYPVVWDWDGTLGAGPLGYYGFCHHAAGMAYLGSPPSVELDADVLPDQDLVTNIDPPSDTPNRDLLDDGVTFPGPLPRCVPVNVSFTGQNNSGGPVYLNAWADWNRDGDWEDGSLCCCGDDEWAIQDYIISASTFSVSIPITPCHSPGPAEPIWVRAILSEAALQPRGTPWTYGGQPNPATQGCFALGETEDFLLQQSVAYVPLVTKRY